MKRFPKLVSADKRGQFVIPKEVRDALDIDETTGFYVYIIPDEGILLKRVNPPDLENDKTVDDLKQHAEQLGISPEALDRAIKDYKKEEGL